MQAADSLSSPSGGENTCLGIWAEHFAHSSRLSDYLGQCFSNFHESWPPLSLTGVYLILYIVTLGLCDITAKLPSEGLCSCTPENRSVAPKGGEDPFTPIWYWMYPMTLKIYVVEKFKTKLAISSKTLQHLRLRCDVIFQVNFIRPCCKCVKHALFYMSFWFMCVVFQVLHSQSHQKSKAVNSCSNSFLDLLFLDTPSTQWNASGIFVTLSCKHTYEIFIIIFLCSFSLSCSAQYHTLILRQPQF